MRPASSADRGAWVRGYGRILNVNQFIEIWGILGIAGAGVLNVDIYFPLHQ